MFLSFNLKLIFFSYNAREAQKDWDDDAEKGSSSEKIRLEENTQVFFLKRYPQHRLMLFLK